MQNQEIKDLISPVIAIAQLVDEVADGVSLGDVFKLVGVLKKVKPAIDAVKSGKLVDEYKALDDASKAELSAWFESELDLKNDQVEKAIEQAWVVLLSLNDLVKLLKPSPVVPA